MKALIKYGSLSLLGLLSLLYIIDFFVIWNKNDGYSKTKEIHELIDHVEENGLDYYEFFQFASNLKSQIKWEAVTDELQSLQSGDQHPDYILDKKVHFRRSDGFGSSRSYELDIFFSRDTTGSSLLPDASLHEFLTPEFPFDSLYDYAEKVNVESFTILKDGTVTTEVFIGADIFDFQTYELIYPGSDIMLYGKVIQIGYGLYLGVKN